MKKANKRKKTDKTTRQTHGNSHKVEREGLGFPTRWRPQNRLNFFFPELKMYS